MHLPLESHGIKAQKRLYSLVGILDVTGADCIDAVTSNISDYEDAVLERVAISKSMDYIVTRNVKDYQLGNMNVILPDNFIAHIEADK